MTAKSTGVAAVDALYKVRKGQVDFIDVPELGFVAVDGGGDPNGPAFAAAIQTLYSVSYTAHFTLKKATGAAPAVMMLEALWWVDGPDAQQVMERMASGSADLSDGDRARWR